MGYNEKELLGKVESEKQDIVLPSKRETIGDILRKKREESGKTIEYISDYLKIKPQYLLALEEDRFNALPGQAYVIGFIKSYATFLKIENVQNIINQYKAENVKSISDVQPSQTDENSLIEDPIINSNHLIIGSVVAIICILGIFVFSNSSDDTVEISKAPVEIEATSSQPTEDVEIVLDSSFTSASTSNDAPISTTEEPKQEEIKTDISFSSQNDAPEVASEETSTPSTQENVEEVAIVEEVVVPEPNVYGREYMEDSKIRLPSKDERVWVKLKGNGLYKYDEESGDIGTGETVFETILNPNDIYYIPNEENLYLTIGNARGVDIIVDGIAIKPLSTKPISRHNIEMDTEKLKNGTAYVRNRVLD
jgi:cytoskeletal protein RodZ